MRGSKIGAGRAAARRRVDSRFQAMERLARRFLPPLWAIGAALELDLGPRGELEVCDSSSSTSTSHTLSLSLQFPHHAAQEACW
jgi:hypothetical protein